MKKIARRIYLFFKKEKLRRTKKIKFGPGAKFSRNTEFGGNNYISTRAEIIDSSIGFASYLGKETIIANTKIGNYTSIGPYVKCIFGNHPTKKFVSTHPAFFSTRKQSGFSFVQKNLFNEFAVPHEKGLPYTIHIGNDVWIGANVTILDGVKIGDGAVIASGALVNNDVEPYAIVGGVPAKTIKKRFSEDDIEFLLLVKWWDKDFEWIKNKSFSFTDIKEFKKLMS